MTWNPVTPTTTELMLWSAFYTCTGEDDCREVGGRQTIAGPSPLTLPVRHHAETPADGILFHVTYQAGPTNTSFRPQPFELHGDLQITRLT